MPADSTETKLILDAAGSVADLLDKHPTVAKYKQAQKALQDDPDASRLLQEFNSVVTQITHNERAGLPPTEEQRRKFELMQTQIASHLKFKAYSLAEYEMTDLMRRISQTWQKPLAAERPTGTEPADAIDDGPRLVM